MSPIAIGCLSFAAGFWIGVIVAVCVTSRDRAPAISLREIGLIEEARRQMEMDSFVIRADGLPHNGMPQMALTADEWVHRKDLLARLGEALACAARRAVPEGESR